jgi:hypothetical protein
LWDNTGRKFGTEFCLAIVAFVTWRSPAVSLPKETQDYAARFGLSSQRFEQVFETAFPRVT